MSGQRKAKEEGDVNRQLSTYYDNASSLSSDEITAQVKNSTSSLSPPLAPGPPPLIMNEDDLKIKNNVAEKLVNEKEQIEKMLKDLEERREKINKYFFEYFRSICIGERQFDYNNTTFNYLLPNTFIKGGQIEIHTSDGKRYFDKLKKDKKNGFIHNKAALISMGFDDGTEFYITLGPAPILDDTNVIFGEIVQGFNILELINKNGIRTVTGGGGGACYI